MDVSICVATYRRPEGLARLLASLGRMKLPPELRVEILVVDNDPDAPEAAPLPDAGGLPARRLREPERNIARARNRAVEAARGAWVAFVDDDETVDEAWLAAYLAQAERTPCDVLFGAVLARAARPDPRRAAALACMARPRFASGARVGLESARTTNALARRRLFEGVRFDAAFGLSGGSDTVLFAELLARGAEFRWCDEAVSVEWYGPERLRAAWLLQRAFRVGNVHGRLARRDSPTQSARAWLHAAGGVAAAAVRLPLLLCGSHPRALRTAMRAASAIGHIYGLCGHVYEEYRG